jgi:hypothetical protein
MLRLGGCSGHPRVETAEGATFTGSFPLGHGATTATPGYVPCFEGACTKQVPWHLMSDRCFRAAILGMMNCFSTAPIRGGSESLSRSQSEKSCNPLHGQRTKYLRTADAVLHAAPQIDCVMGLRLEMENVSASGCRPVISYPPITWESAVPPKIFNSLSTSTHPAQQVQVVWTLVSHIPLQRAAKLPRWTSRTLSLRGRHC